MCIRDRGNGVHPQLLIGVGHKGIPIDAQTSRQIPRNLPVGARLEQGVADLPVGEAVFLVLLRVVERVLQVLPSRGYGKHDVGVFGVGLEHVRLRAYEIDLAERLDALVDVNLTLKEVMLLADDDVDVDVTLLCCRELEQRMM